MTTKHRLVFRSIVKQLKLATILTACAVLVVTSSAVYAIDFKFFSDNNITMFDPRGGGPCAPGGGDLNSPRPTSLRGADNVEKAWNYFMDRGLTPVAAAGVMGNIYPESGFNPFAGERRAGCNVHPGNINQERCGWGIIQWTPASAFDANKEPDTPAHIITGNTSADGNNDEYLLWQLHALWRRGSNSNGEPVLWEALNQESSVGSYTSPIPPANSAGGTQFNDTSGGPQGFGAFYMGHGSAYFYHAASVRSADRDWGLVNGTPHSSYRGHGNIRWRPWHAARILERYGGGVGVGCGVGNSDWSDPDSIREMFYQEVVVGAGNRWQSGTGNWLTHCWNGCTVVPAWFVDTRTTLRHNGGNGRDVVRNMAAVNPEVNIVDFPIAPAIFSSNPGHWGASNEPYGHTGLVISVEGNTATVVGTWNGLCNNRPPLYVATREIPRNLSQVMFINLGDHLR